jgi:hypothetical protein
LPASCSYLKGPEGISGTVRKLLELTGFKAIAPILHFILIVDGEQ